MTEANPEYMRLAIELAEKNLALGGGPFGAVIVRRGDGVIATGANQVVPTHDPTAHAEVNAIRNACRALGTHDLRGCEIYTSCEPCPMCLGAIYWAHVDRIYYACTRHDAARIGFDDEFIYREISLDPSARSRPMLPFMRPEAIAVFEHWAAKPDKDMY